MRVARIIPFLISAVALTVAACGDAPDARSDGGEANGEVLEGSISDAMIPLDQLQSQGEPLEVSGAAAGEDGGKPNSADNPQTGARPRPDSAPGAGSDAASDAPAEEEAPGED